MAQDIAFAHAALLRRQPMTRRHVFDIDKIHACFDIARHPVIEKIHDHLARRRRLDILRPDRRRRVHNHQRKTFRGVLSRHPIGGKFGPLIRTHQLIRRGIEILRTYGSLTHPPGTWGSPLS